MEGGSCTAVWEILVNTFRLGQNTLCKDAEREAEDTRCKQRDRDGDKLYVKNDWGEGGDTTIPSPGRSTKQPLPGMELHDPLHARQACPKFIAFDRRVGQICPR